MSAASSYATRLAALRAPLPAEPALADLLRVATLAASGHNTQPWRFRPRHGGLDILPDLSRRTPVVDPDDHHLWTSLGCAAQTLVLAARSRGMSADAGFVAGSAGGERIALDLAAGTTVPAEEADLAAAIVRRQSTRALYDGRPIPPALVARMVREAARHGVALLYLSETRAIEDVLALVVAGNTAQIRDRAFVAELKSWLRWNERQALSRGDGLFAGASGNPSSPSWLGPILFDLVFREGRENDKVAAQIRSSSGLVVLVAGTDDPAGWAAAGRAYTAAALAATAAGATLAFVNQCVEVPAQRAALRALLGLGDRRPNLVLRIGYGPPMPQSPRRAVEEVMVAG